MNADDPCLAPAAGAQSEEAHRRRVVVIRTIVAAGVALAITWVGWAAMHAAQPRVSPVQPVSLLDALPRPPPPPADEIREEIEPPEEPLPQDFVEFNPAPDTAGEAFDDSLGVDAEGSGAGDAFGLRAKKGGRSLVDLGARGDAADPAAAWRVFAGQVVERLQRVLNRVDAVRRVDYEVRVALWLGADGRVTRVVLERPTGDDDLDRAIVEALETHDARIGPPPEDMPQPVHVRVRSRGAG